jgi:hypothetical protein
LKVVVGIFGGIIAILVAVIIALIVLLKKRQRLLDSKNNKQIHQLGDRKGEQVMIENEMNTVTLFDETNTSTTTLSTYQPGIHSSQINKQTHSLFINI